MTTTARLDQDTKDELAEYKEEHDLSSIDAAIDHALNQLKDLKYTAFDRFPNHGHYFEEVHENIGLKESYPLPPEFARIIMNREHEQGGVGENEWVSRLFSLVSRHQYLLNTKTMEQVDVLHVYEIGSMGYAFILAKLNETPGDVRERTTNGNQTIWGWGCDATSFPNEFSRVMDTNDFIAPTQPIPDTLTYRGYNTRLEDTLQSHPDLAERLQDLPSYEEFLNEFFTASKNAYELDDEDLVYENPDAPDNDPEKRINFAASIGKETIRDSFTDEHQQILNTEDPTPTINPFNPFNAPEALLELIKVWSGEVQTQDALTDKFEELFVEPPTWTN